jgi:hypothetical protein
LEILSGPEGDERADDDELEAEDEEELATATAAIEGFDFLGSEVAFLGWDQIVGHGKYLSYGVLKLLNHKGGDGRCPLQEGDGLDAGDVEAFAAADVLAGEYVVGTDHVALGLGEAGAVALVCTAAELGFLAADQPSDLVLTGLAAVGTGHGVGSLLGFLVEKVTFFHAGSLLESASAVSRREILDVLLR